MTLIALPAFADNYIWMLHDGHNAVVVDPGDAAPVLTALEALGLALRAILVTHHHADHTGGLEVLRARLDGVVYAPAAEPVPGPFEPVQEATRFEAIGAAFEVIEVPGHTAGHVAYFCMPSDDSVPVLFCGDTLFSAGCGRLFEGTAAQMLDSLRRLAALPPDTRVCCAHEYTESNLRFAQMVEPDNEDVATHAARCRALRSEGKPTLPSTLEIERRINPFLRTAVPSVQSAACHHGAKADDEVAIFAALREWKNQCR
ncbi:MAG: hydroxyacylglutathione hydrolase [Burkholderiaceae bacterium]|jgi:hydroxyacylglutathione hydrolase|nr:hydroxyacylglutathione hydrolase [Aquabacterium sp.]NUP84174.1 hydroxyacylglutathione hydrolase [Burkholderiaceae bacterium]